MTENRLQWKVDTSRSLISKNVTAIIGKPLRQIGIGRVDSEIYTSYSIKRARLNYTSLSDGERNLLGSIFKFIDIERMRNYCSAYNNCREITFLDLQT